MTTKLEDRVSKAREKAAQAKARLQELEAKKSAIQRKQETRQKIVIGGTVLAEMRDDEGFRRQIVKLLSQRVTRENDKTAVREWLTSDSGSAT